MTRIKLKFAAPLIAVCLCLSLSVFALSDGEEPAAERQDAASTLDHIDVEEIQRQVERSLEAVPWDEIGQQLADVRGILNEIDLEGIRAEVEAAVEEIDAEAIQAEVRESLEDVDWDEIRQEILDAQAEIEATDMEAIQSEVLEALEGVDWDEIRQTLEEATGLAAEELEALDEALKELGTGGSGVI